jgi:hypothetical protein
MSHPRYFYNMFWMNPNVFMALHDLLILNYGLISSVNVSSVESLAMLLRILGGLGDMGVLGSPLTRLKVVPDKWVRPIRRPTDLIVSPTDLVGGPHNS